MDCANCGYHNPEDARFCQNCGQSLALVCRVCNTQNARDAKFCKSCGSPLAKIPDSSSPTPHDLSPDPRLARLTAAAPSDLARKMRLSSGQAGERRVVTCLFADVVGSTSLAEDLDPEVWTGIINQAFDRMISCVYRYEGTIARLMGDAILAFFGAPVAHEDDPQRAAHAALDMIASIRSYAAELQERHNIQFEIRIGLNTGPVVVGTVGNDLVYEYTAMGDAINLAARLQSFAAPMQVLVSENTYRYIAPAFFTTDLGEISVKGRAASVQVYEITGTRQEPGKGRGLAGMESQMVGRLAELQALLELSQVVAGGLGRAVLVLGEAGLGKSRLVSEWQSAVSRSSKLHSLVWAEGHSLSYGKSLPYHLASDLVISLLGLGHGATEAQLRAALQARLAELPAGREINSAMLGQLLALDLTPVEQERLRMIEPHELQAGYSAALQELMLHLARQQPRVIILEDIHWADVSSASLLGGLVSQVHEAPLLFCCVSRPDRESPGWALVTALRAALGPSLLEIELHSLDESDSDQLVSNLLEVAALPDALRLLIMKKAEGNPFFVEELIRMLIDHGHIGLRDGRWQALSQVEALDLPDTVQGLLQARIDRLPEDLKHTLKVASVIGRRFPVQLLERMLAGRG